MEDNFRKIVKKGNAYVPEDCPGFVPAKYILETRIANTELSERTKLILEANGIETIDDLRRLKETDFLNFQGANAKSMAELDNLLKSNYIDWGYEDKCGLDKEAYRRYPKDRAMEWINVEDRLPELGVHVFVYGEIDPSFEGVILPGMPSKKYVWITKRINPSNVTDGNGFCRMYLRGHLDIKYWLPIPKLNGEEIFETLPVDV